MIGKRSLPLAVLKTLFLAIWLVITAFPLYWIVITSFKEPGSITSYPIKYWPSHFSLENYTQLFTLSNFFVNIRNSFVAALVAGAVATSIALLSGYVLSKFEFRGKTAVFLCFLITQMLPAFIALGPLYIMMTHMDLVNSIVGLILVYIAVCIPFSAIMLKGFFDNIPDELEEASMVDGCNRMQSLIYIIIPVMRPGLIAAFVFNFVNCWNELFLSVTLAQRSSVKTIPAALQGFISSFDIDWGSLSAASVLAIIPSMIIFAFASKHIVAGLTAGAVK
ncbi:MAG: carbohydrate ABC transporter permease [Bifidobacterium sp.]|uniref:carbohydrate ABC transporter permease n=1 Tax=Bifidobacterium sp. TaxID=41200 RepID=UPI0039ED4A32